MHQIIFYTHPSKFGDCPAKTINLFQKWAEHDLAEQYPNHEIIMNDENNLNTCFTDDYSNSDEINDFCSRLWDKWEGN